MKSFRQLSTCWEKQSFTNLKKTKAPSLYISSHLLGPSYHYLFEHIHSRYECIDPSIKDVLGYSSEDMQSEGVDFMDRRIHKDDRESVLNLLFKSWDLIISQPQEFRRFYSFSIDYRLRHRDGHFIHLIQQSRVEITDSLGNIVYSFNTCIDITSWRKITPSTLNIYYKDKLLHHWNFEKANSKVSRREKEILQEICSGNTTTEVAKKLNISRHTVNTHRKTIMRKLGVKGTPALIQYANRHQII